MRSVYAHFPIVCAISDDKKTVEVRNFLGEKRARVVQLRDGVIANRSENVKDEITIEGNDIDAVGSLCRPGSADFSRSQQGYP
eukprot:EC834444.1.p1 GENE.EC834444.1~~EC834444.1.p1  ORF type:complete len:83 (+),score=14.59 EC834444.1:221-469(+)